MKRIIAFSTLLVVIVGLGIIFKFRENEAMKIPDIIIVGVTPDYPPYVYREYSCPIDRKKPEELVLCPKNPAPIGFEIDLITMIGKQLGKQIVIRQLPFESLIPALELQQVHIIAAGLCATQARAERITFSTPSVHINPCVLMVPAQGPIHRLDQVAHTTLLVVQGQIAEQYSTSLNGLHTVTVPTIEVALQKLASNSYDGLITELAALAPFTPQLDMHAYRMILIPEVNEQIAFGVSKTTSGLIAALNQAIITLERNGSLTTLRTRWKLQ